MPKKDAIQMAVFVLGAVLGGCASSTPLVRTASAPALTTAAVQADLDRVIAGEDGRWCVRMMSDGKPGLRCTLNLRDGATIQLPDKAYEIAYGESARHLRGEYRGYQVGYGVECYGWSVREFIAESQTVVCKPLSGK